MFVLTLMMSILFFFQIIKIIKEQNCFTNYFQNLSQATGVKAFYTTFDYMLHKKNVSFLAILLYSR